MDKELEKILLILNNNYTPTTQMPDFNLVAIQQINNQVATAILQWHISEEIKGLEKVKAEILKTDEYGESVKIIQQAINSLDNKDGK